MATKQIYRPTMSSDDIFDLVDILETLKRTSGLSGNMRKLLSKLDSMAYDIGKGNKTPAYIASGIREKTKPTLENLMGVEIVNNSNTINVSEDAKREAIFAAETHNIITGENKTWMDFIAISTNESLTEKGNHNHELENSNVSPNDNIETDNSNDHDLFASITSKITINDL